MRYYTKERSEHYARVAERNRKMTFYLGTVSCDLHPCSSLVRVSILGPDNIPLSVKASLGGYPRNLFKQTVTVEVEQTWECHGRQFRVTHVYEAVKKPSEVHGGNFPFTIHVKDAEAFRKEQTMFTSKTMSHDRVRFFISDNYYNTQHKKETLLDVLKQSFDLNKAPLGHYMAGCYGGFYIICRPSQFARFLIFRNAAGIKNGFIDLQADLYVPEPKLSPFDALSKKAGVDPTSVKKVVNAMGLGRNDVETALEDDGDGPPAIDVSMNKYLPR